MMEDSVYTTLIRQFRNQTGLSQREIADILGVRQATVSRIEAGKVMPSKDLADKIRQLPLKEVRPEQLPAKRINLEIGIKTSHWGNFNVSQLLIPFGEKSGDFCSFDKLTGNKYSLILTDTVGHGIDASRMSFAVGFGYRTILASFNAQVISAELIERTLREAIYKTGKDWLGPPGIISGTIDVETGTTELINAGQPVPLLFNSGEVTELDSRPRPGTSELLGARVEATTTLNTIKPGGTLALYSDGFVELFNSASGQNFRDRFAKSAKSFKGDSRAILTNLFTAISKEMEINSRQLKDDATILLISRIREK